MNSTTLKLKLCLSFFLATFVALLGTAAGAAETADVIEPDSFADGTDLNDINPRVDLRIFDGFSLDDFPNGFGVIPAPSIINVTANTKPDIFGGFFTSTGTKTFGHANISFFSESRQLGMRFAGRASSISIDFIGTNSLSTQVGRLDVYDVRGELLDSIITNELSRQDVETLSINRAMADIKFARAYSDPGFNPFGTLDSLRFTSVPEPGAMGLGVVSLTALAYRRRVRREAVNR